MKIIAVCGMGIGTSVLLKMNIDQALDNLGLEGDVEAADISSARGAAASADLVMTSAELVEQLGDIDTPVIVVDNFVDQAEVQEKLQQGLEL
ncbi:PTS sugar transporter subunit IIB [Gulosibacter molinativorax]|uniref:PTS ascorbate transporter subunit IIB n=1 Tax=Gulosibacter molinativorax TaxID=256821 RepID=A0ABT7C935_9MICO|nr:PTS sugar transporter subunit IIB [Gulosibacter molinativorax]MDJ1371623.1 PTS ascorbate transporter subunit IIB [Gulosibacter molinativorax]QUY61034.1 Ascorbate-specific phosphotransferase enzyme IIB component [Gulosibacter molinativorax]